MDPQKWNFEFIQLELKVNWKISRNTSTFKKNLLVTFKDLFEGQIITFKGEAAPNIRYAETVQLLQDDIETFKTLLIRSQDIITLYQLVMDSKLTNCFKFAISSIYHQWQAKKNDENLFQYLKLPKVEKCVTSFSIPILEKDQIYPYLVDNELLDSNLLKLKVRNDQDIIQYQELRKYYHGNVIIDANEGIQSKNQWDLFISKLKDFSKILLIEQPFPSSHVELYQEVFLKSPAPIFLDESITKQPITSQLKKFCHGVNIKLMKSSDIMIAKHQLENARKLGLQTMLGCMIETSLSISMAFHLSSLADIIDLDGFALLKNDPGQVMSYKRQMLKLDLSPNYR